MFSSTLSRFFFRTTMFVVLLTVVSFSQGSKFVQVATASNIAGDYTVIDNPSLNGNPNAIIFVTPNWNPQGIGGIYDNAAIGVWYTGSNWAIFNQDVSNMPVGAAFNVLIPSGGQVFIHTANNSNISGNTTSIDNPALNGNPNAIFFVTQNWNPAGSGGIYNNSEIGVWYDGAHWGIFNQNLSTMPQGASFNVLIPSGSDMFVQTATASNIIGDWTGIDNSSLNGNPNAIFFVTQNWNPGGVGGIYDPSPIGVWYTSTEWAVFDQDISSMPVGASFNIYLASGVATGVANNNDLPVQNFKLEQNYPNPFNPSTKIQYQIPGSGRVKIDVTDILGRYITTLVNEDKSSGTYEVTFNAADLPSGIYFYHIQSGQFSQTRKMMLLK